MPVSRSGGLFLTKPFPHLLFLPSHLFSSPPQSLSFPSHIPAGRSVSCDVIGRVCVCVCVSPDALPYKDPICAGATCKHTPSKNIHPVALHSSLPVEERSSTPADAEGGGGAGGTLPPSSSLWESGPSQRCIYSTRILLKGTSHPWTSQQYHRIKVIVRFI